MRTTDICEFIALNEDSTKKKEPNYRLLEITNTETKNQKPIYKIPLDCLTISPDVFQFRDIEQGLSGEYFKSKGHTNKLKKPLLNPSKELKPITIAWGKIKGEKSNWIVVDGHHRVKAYRKAKREYISVVIFEGSPKEIVLKSIEANNEDKLPMTSKDKIEAAWAIWVMMIGDKERWATVSKLGASNGTMSNFGKTEKAWAEKIKAKDKADTQRLRMVLAQRNWKEARRDLTEDTEMNNFDEDALVRSWAERLFKGFGHTARKSPKVFFRAAKEYMGENTFESMLEYYKDFDDLEF